jgi:protein import protein ZIM17
MGLMLIMFTCGVCNSKQGRTFSKDSYTKGVVLIRCEGCDNLHLIADNLGWFKDSKSNIETIMKEKGEQIYKYNSKETMEFVMKEDIKILSEEQ